MAGRRGAQQKPIGARCLLPGALLGALAIVVTPSPAVARPPAAETDAVMRLCAQGADAAMARAVRAEGAAEVRASGVLPNPSIVLQHQQTLEGPRDRESIIALSVPIGLGGRRFLRQDAATARRAASDASGDALLVELAVDAQEALSAAALDARRAQVLDDHQRALDALDAVLAGLARGGEAARHDQARQRLQARLHRTRQEEARARASSSAELVRGWLGIDVTSLDAPSLLSVDAPPPGPAGSAPRLVALDAAADASGLDADVADRAWVPDVDLFAGYRNVDPGGGGVVGHGLTLGLTVPLTVFDHGQGDAARARAAEGVARARLAAEQARVQRSERAAASRLRRLLATASDVRSAERDAAEVARASRDLYAAGETSLTDLFAAYEALEDARLAWLDRLASIASARVELMRARGGLLDPALQRACLAASRGEKR